jgi:putative glutamine amidotransferase
MIDFFSKTRPVIGISGGNADSASVRAMMTQIASSGATPLFLGNHAQRDAAADVEKIDALVVMGNNADIDPERYGQEKHPRTHAESATPGGKARAEYEYALMEKALQSGMPFLGVCGGMQRLNVMTGGDLHQHVPDLTGNDHHMQHIAPFVPVEPVHLEANSTLAHIGDSILALFVPWHKDYVYNENSMHHQSVNHVGKGLRAAAYAEDALPDGSRLVEAIEADPNGPFKHQFMLGVQWHPEFSASELGAKIATRLTQEAQQFARTHSRAHPPAQAQRENILSALDPENMAGFPARAGSMVDRVLKQRAAQSVSNER